MLTAARRTRWSGSTLPISPYADQEGEKGPKNSPLQPSHSRLKRSSISSTGRQRRSKSRCSSPPSARLRPKPSASHPPCAAISTMSLAGGRDVKKVSKACLMVVGHTGESKAAVLGLKIYRFLKTSSDFPSLPRSDCFKPTYPNKMLYLFAKNGERCQFPQFSTVLGAMARAPPPP